MSVVGERPPADARSSAAARAAAAARSRTRRPTRSTGIPARPGARRRPALPELNEPEVVRHYVNLSQLNYAVDTGFYPLGSCTMKYNPKVNEWAARLPGFARLHPHGPGRGRAGHAPAAVRAGGDARRDQRHGGGDAPAGGRRPRRADRHPDDPRLPPLARRPRARPRSSSPTRRHGTNPATATMAGFRTITIPSAPDGGVDLDAFRAALGPRPRRS